MLAISFLYEVYGLRFLASKSTLKKDMVSKWRRLARIGRRGGAQVSLFFI